MNRENTYSQTMPVFLQALFRLLAPLPEKLLPFLSGSSVQEAKSNSVAGGEGEPAAPPSREEGPRLYATATEAMVRPNKVRTGVKIDNTIYRQVDEPPLFLHYEWLSADMHRDPLAHTVEALTYFVSQTLQYPKMARRVGIKGKVGVHFIVERNGSVSHIEARSRLGFGCREEAVRIFEKMNELGLRWEPARIGGRAVRKSCLWVVEFDPRD